MQNLSTMLISFKKHDLLEALLNVQGVRLIKETSPISPLWGTWYMSCVYIILLFDFFFLAFLVAEISGF